MRIVLIFVFITSGCCGFVFGQTEPIYGIENIRKVIPPSPEASSLGKFGDIPVSLYTGIPQVSIPVYTIQEKGIEIPITLNYHAGGVRVEEHASWVGLGWSLSAGGVITRSVVGLADDETGGYFTQPYDLENFENLSVEQLRNIQASVAANTLDIEPDIYSFSFLNQSGKFIVNKNTRKGMPVKKQNLQIEIINFETPGDSRIKGWKLTDDQGNVFHFEIIERSRVRSHTATNRTAHVFQNHVSSWYLSKIVLRNQATITFNYQSHNSEYYTRQGSSKYLFLAGGFEFLTCQQAPTDYEKYLSHDVAGQHIESIVFSNGTVKFVRDPLGRQDMPGDYALDRVEVYSSQSATIPIKRTKLVYSYFDSNASLNAMSSGLVNNYNTNFKKRLKLDRIEEVGQGTRKNVHSFEYFPGELPSIFSNSQDHWGFYNGADNVSLVPLDQVGYGSASVSRAVNFLQARIGTLSKINYPTGGYTEFVYESNEASISESDFNTYFYPYGPVSMQHYGSFGAAVYKFPEPDESTLIDTVHVDANPQQIDGFGNNAQYSVQLDNSTNCNGGDRTCLGTLSITLTCITCGNIPSYFNLASCQFSNGACWGVFKLIAGMSYVLKIERGHEFASVSASVGGRFYLPPPGSGGSNPKRNLIVGGLRIKSLLNYPSANQQPVRTDYYYTQAPDFVPETHTGYESSGVLTAFPIYDSYNNFVSEMNFGIFAECLFRLRTANSRIPLGGFDGTVVGYSDVQTYKTDGQQKIKTISSFYTAADNPDVVDYSFPFVVLNSNAHMRGMLRREVQYQWKSNQFVPVTETKSNYKSSSNNYNAGVRTGVTIFAPLGQGDYIYKVYYHPSEFVYLENTRNTIYDANGANPVTTTVDYFYENPAHLSATKTEATQSNGHIINTQLKYAHDFSTPVYTDMVNRNFISPVIEQTQVNVTLNKPVSRTLTEFTFWQSGSFTDIQNVKRALGSSALETEVTVAEYDTKGNIVQYTDRTGVPVSILWGYGSTVPVAKVTNATAAVAKTYVTQSVLDNPVDDASLRTHLHNLRSIPGALVNTYTYKPLVGITSEVDANNRVTFYSYDDFNRLSLVKDDEGNILKRVCYNYAGQVDACTDAPSWVNTGNTRCKPCAANASYISNILQNERRDVNPSSPTYNQTSWVDAGVSPDCVTAVWLPTATPVRCVKDTNNQNTGYVEREEVDANPCSAGYNQRRWIVFDYNVLTCPLPVTCNTGNCSGINKRCVFGTCETGVLVVDTYERDEMGRCMMYYHYEWSDGSQSEQYSQAASSSNCNQ